MRSPRGNTQPVPTPARTPAPVPGESCFDIPEVEGGRRLDVIVAARLPHLSRAAVQRLIRAGAVTVGGVPAKAATRARAGARVAVRQPASAPPPSALQPAPIPLTVLFEDPWLLVIDKPSGLAVHPGAGTRTETLVNALLHRCRTLSGLGGAERPGIVHRLDRGTTGCLLVARDDSTHHALSGQFARREVHKVYLALAHGRLEGAARAVDAPIGRHPTRRDRMTILDTPRGRRAHTVVEPVAWGTDFTVVRCEPHTGRTHQIRLHLRSLGHPVLGDALYGYRHARPASRLMLHAWRIGFRHPATGQWREFEAPLPADFRSLSGEAEPPVP